MASDVARQSITLGAIFGVAFGVGFVVFAAPLLRLLGANDEVVAVATPILAFMGASPDEIADVQKRMVRVWR